MLGGISGYGQYILWIQGNFYRNGTDNTIPINPFIGYIWLMICGAAWGGVAGIFLGWALGEPVSLKQWSMRIFIPFIFVGIGILIIIGFPFLIFPNYSPELYTKSNCPDCSRTISTNITNFLVLMWWLGSLIVDIFEKNNDTLVCGAVMGVSFGIVFWISAIWTLGFVWAPGYIDWRKIWELTIGMGGGILIALMLFSAQKNVDSRYNPNGEPIISHLPAKNNIKNKNKQNKRAWLLPNQNLRRQFLLIFSLYLLLFITFYGLTYKLGIFIGLYEQELVEQYGVPIKRMILVIPAVILFIGFLLSRYIQLYKIAKNQGTYDFYVSNVFLKTIHIVCFITLAGVISLWSSKIVVFYIVCLWLSLYALIILDNILPENKMEKK